MKKFLIKSKFKYLSVILSLLLAVAILFSTGASFNSYADAAEKEEKKLCAATIDDSFAEDKVIVIMDDGADNFKTYSAKDFPEAEISAVEDLTQSIKDMLRRQSAGSEEENRLFNRESFKTVLRLTLKYAGKQNVLNAVHTFERRADIFCAEPDFILENESTTVEESCVGTSTYLSEVVSDETINKDWWQKSIRLKNAKEMTKGSASVKVGIIDSGIDSAHASLQNNISKTLGCSYFINKDKYIDEVGHGTHVAGLVGAKENEILGIEGVNEEVELVSLQLAGDMYFASNLVKAIAYAIAERIPVLNLSSSIENYEKEFNNKDYATDLNSFEWILYNYNGLLVASAGNQNKQFNSSGCTFPVSSDKHNMLVVGALDSEGRRWEVFKKDIGSNYGNGVDIYAPGVNIFSTFSTTVCDIICSKSDWELTSDSDKETKKNHVSKGYHYMTGTSMAAPIVTGVAALLLSINSGLNGKELKELILNYADEISMSYDGATHTVKKLNAYDSVLALRGTTFKTENVTSDSLKITGIEGEMPERLIIPEKIIGKKVVSIAQNAFLRCENIKSLKFSNISTLRTIGVSAFGECKNLTEVVFPDSVTKIDCAAFIDCKNLKSIIFFDDSELNVIEVAAFGGCSSLTQIELPKNLSTLCISAFNSCTNLNKVVFKNTYRAADIGSSCFDNTASSLKLYVSYNLLSTYISSVSGYADKFVCL